MQFLPVRISFRAPKTPRGSLVTRFQVVSKKLPFYRIAPRMREKSLPV
jgi:hypothetical protein